MRVLHTSDWHLGRSILGLPLHEDQQVFGEHLIELVHDFRPDLVIVLGDLFDRSIPSEDSLQLLDHVLQRLLLECKVRVLLAPGLQDGVARLSFGAWLYERRQLHLITNLEQALSPILLEDADGPVHVNAIPFLRAKDIDSHFRTQTVQSHGRGGEVILEHLTRFRRLRRRSVRGIVAGYLAVEGCQTNGEERPLEGDLVPPSAFDGLNYAALGYCHNYQLMEGEPPMCYSGSPFAFQFEASPVARGVVKLELNAQGNVRSELVPFPVWRHFYRFSGSLERLLLGSPQALEARDLVVLELTQDSDLLTAELIVRLRQLYPNLWRIERPENHTPQSPAGGDFETFYRDTWGQPLEEDSRQLLDEIFTEVKPL